MGSHILICRAFIILFKIFEWGIKNTSSAIVSPIQPHGHGPHFHPIDTLEFKLRDFILHAHLRSKLDSFVGEQGGVHLYRYIHAFMCVLHIYDGTHYEWCGGIWPGKWEYYNIILLLLLRWVVGGLYEVEWNMDDGILVLLLFVGLSYGGCRDKNIKRGHFYYIIL